MFNFNKIKAAFSSSSSSASQAALAARTQAELDYREAILQVKDIEAIAKKARLKELELVAEEQFLGELNRQSMENEAAVARFIANIKIAKSKIEQHKNIAAESIKNKSLMEEPDSP